MQLAIQFANPTQENTVSRRRGSSGSGSGSGGSSTGQQQNNNSSSLATTNAAIVMVRSTIDRLQKVEDHLVHGEFGDALTDTIRAISGSFDIHTVVQRAGSFRAQNADSNLRVPLLNNYQTRGSNWRSGGTQTGRTQSAGQGGDTTNQSQNQQQNRQPQTIDTGRRQPQRMAASADQELNSNLDFFINGLGEEGIRKLQKKVNKRMKRLGEQGVS
jgi:hypothetical protein